MPVVDKTADSISASPNLETADRSDSLRSTEDDDATSFDKRVSFNNDVRIKRIPNKTNHAHHNKRGHSPDPPKVTHEAPPIDPEAVEAETQQILQQLEGIECSVSNSAQNTLKSGKKLPQDNRLYGLHALNNLDIAVNGKEVNSMPSYHEIRRNSLVNGSQSDLERPAYARVSLHSVKYDPISAHVFPWRYCRNLTMEYESIQLIKKFAIFSFWQFPQGYWQQATKIRAIFQF